MSDIRDVLKDAQEDICRRAYADDDPPEDLTCRDIRRAIAEIDRMREALVPFSREAENYDFPDGTPDDPDSHKIDDLGVADITVGHLRAARDALGKANEPKTS